MSKNSAMAFSSNVKSSSSNKNFVFEVSYFKCTDSILARDKTLEICHGEQRFNNNNITNNKNNEKASVSSGLSGSSGICKYSTFRENSQYKGASLSFASFSSNSTRTLSYCNVIENNCGTNERNFVIVNSGPTTIDHCIFRNNTADYMFGNWIGCDTFTITNSYFDSYSKSGSIIVSYTNSTDKYDFNQFIYFYRENCLLNPNEISIELCFLSKITEASATELFS